MGFFLLLLMYLVYVYMVQKQLEMRKFYECSALIDKQNLEFCIMFCAKNLVEEEVKEERDMEWKQKWTVEFTGG
uniref:Ovule protein n=1 Tax=Syphacia muris TaxID=451379 RepID=A0A0N5AQ86_9BILA